MADLPKTDYRRGYTLHHVDMLDALHCHGIPAFRAAMDVNIVGTQRLLNPFLKDRGAGEAGQRRTFTPAASRSHAVGVMPSSRSRNF